MILQSMLLSLAMLGQGSYDINEQQINQYLQSQVQVNKQLELPGIIKAHVQLEQSDVQIGRQSRTPPGSMARASSRSPCRIRPSTTRG